MKITRLQIRNILKEAMDPVRVKTVAPEDFNPPVWSDASEPKSTEIPKKRVGNFFMTDPSKELGRGFGAIKNIKKFYVILPDGEAVRIGPFQGEPRITKIKDGVSYLEALDAGVDVLPIIDIYNPSEEDQQNMLSMQNQIMAVAKRFGT